MRCFLYTCTKNVSCTKKMIREELGLGPPSARSSGHRRRGPHPGAWTMPAATIWLASLKDSLGKSYGWEGFGSRATTVLGISGKIWPERIRINYRPRPWIFFCTRVPKKNVSCVENDWNHWCFDRSISELQKRGHDGQQRSPTPSELRLGTPNATHCRTEIHDLFRFAWTIYPTEPDSIYEIIKLRCIGVKGRIIIRF